jgi:non-homologous end joining protein Ku
MVSSGWSSKGIEAEANSSIDLKEFIPLASVDPVYFESTHYLGGQRRREAVAKSSWC